MDSSQDEELIINSPAGTYINKIINYKETKDCYSKIFFFKFNWRKSYII